MPDLSDAESGGRAWRGWCVPYVMECLRLPQHVAWVAAVLADGKFNSLRELADDICNDAWGRSSENRAAIISYLDWLAIHDIPLGRRAI
eukprot:1841929-Pyramimonas_sp.AAC.1